MSEEKAAVWDIALTTGSLIREQYQIENPGLSIFWTIYGVQCWFNTLDMSKQRLIIRATSIKMRANLLLFWHLCPPFKREVINPGRPIPKDGYHPDLQNNDPLEKFRTLPKIICKLRILLGFLSFYCAYIKIFFSG